MQKFGEMCIIAYQDTSHQAKLANYNKPGIWVGFAKGRPVFTYWVDNPKKKSNNRGDFPLQVIWWNKVENPMLISTKYEMSDNDEMVETNFI